MSRSEALLDTCCIINLCAIQRSPVRLFAEFPFSWKIAKAVAQEEVSVRPHATAARHERLKIDLNPCFEAGVFDLCEPKTLQETALYVELAAEIDDAEAMSLAIASSRGWSLATDDMPARVAAARLKVKTFCTPQLLRMWADRNKIPHADVIDAIKSIEQLARYVPRYNLPDATWWKKIRSA